ncbi:MAG: excisionase family DNA-binding protein [Phycisphaeraceae bacterium]|nr:excisionase family DNA-binding protein [Phycisphaeraceae bacterium]
MGKPAKDDLLDNQTVISAAEKKGSEGKQGKACLSTTELAKRVGVSRFTIVNWINQGKVKAFKTVGGKYRIFSSDADKLLESLLVEGKRDRETAAMPGADAMAHCWDYPHLTNCHTQCEHCLVPKHRDQHCFMVMRHCDPNTIGCRGRCFACAYFKEYFGERNEQGSIETDPRPKPDRAKLSIQTSEKTVLQSMAYCLGKGVHGFRKKGKDE